MLVMTEGRHRELAKYLFPGDGLEAAAVLLCNQGTGIHNQRLVVAELLYLPHEMSVRQRNAVSWPFDEHLPPAKISAIDASAQSIVTVHSHPAGHREFSAIDDTNDHRVLATICQWFDDQRAVGSAIMMPDGEIIARTFKEDSSFAAMAAVSVVGHEIRIWRSCKSGLTTQFYGKLAQTFGSGTLAVLNGLRVGVVGCSGTGSIVTELLVRNGVGTLVLVDNDIVEQKNLNRVLNSTVGDAHSRRPKVLAMTDAIGRIDIGTTVEAYEALTDTSEVLRALVDCDVIFGCVDSAFGRYHLECIASAYYIPYFDVGVHLEADGSGAIHAADAVAHYVHPEGSSLLSRGVYTMDQVTAENLHREDPGRYNAQREVGYLGAVGEEQPAVMSVNMQAACMAFNDFLARVHHYRLDANREFATQQFRLVHGSYEILGDSGSPHPLFTRYAGHGDRSILIQNNTVR